jgi:ABC-type branched-subunit amino acid transport system ATPase component
MPRPGQVLGLVGSNGTGKSTALKILAGKLKPNLGRYADPPDWQEILTYYRGSELQNFFTRVLEDDIKVTFCDSSMFCVFAVLTSMVSYVGVDQTAVRGFDSEGSEGSGEDHHRTEGRSQDRRVHPGPAWYISHSA